LLVFPQKLFCLEHTEVYNSMTNSKNTNYIRVCFWHPFIYALT